MPNGRPRRHVIGQAAPELFTLASESALGDVSPGQRQRLDQMRSRPTTRSLVLVRVDASALAGSRLRVSVPGDVSVELTKVGGEAQNPREFSWVGRQQQAAARATLVVRDGAVTGSIVIADNVYSISPISGSVHAVVSVDRSQYPPDDPPIQPRAVTMDTRSDAGLQNLGPAEIDVMVAYTSAARKAVTDINAEIALAVQDANAAYANSAINTHLNLIATFEISYTETAKDFGTILADFAAMPTVNQNRDAIGADLAVLFMETKSTEWCGLASAIGSTASTAFAIVERDCAVGNHTFAHELGHLMDARHNEQVDSTSGYNHGYRHDSSPAFRDIMSYDCATPCTRQQFFSNPLLKFKGVPTGTTSKNDAARRLNETGPTITRFRARPTSSRLFGDVDGNGREDYCRLVGNAPNIFLSCDLATPTGFDPNQYTFNSIRGIDQGYVFLPRLLGDVNGDGRADYCRFVGNPPNVFLSCDLATATGFDPNQYTFNSIPGIDQGYPTLPRLLRDVNGDRRADYCRFVGDVPNIFLSCNLAGPSGFETNQYSFNSIGGLDLGYPSLPRLLGDVNGDRRADYCRFVGNAPNIFLSCDLATGNGFNPSQYTYNSIPGIDAGYASLPRLLADVNIDGRADYCRFVGNAPNVFLSCNLAGTSGFDTNQYTFSSIRGIDQGYGSLPRVLADVTGDGRADYCRFVGNAPNIFASCNVATANGFDANQYNFNSISGIDLGYAP